MKDAPIPANEKDRLASLQALDILDTPVEERFERITRLAQHLFDVPIAAITLIDAERQWFKSMRGVDGITEAPREISFCGHTIIEKEFLLVEDMLKDKRFADNPFVIGEPKIRFYIGRPLHTEDGHPVGSFCLMDYQPRALNDTQIELLKDLAAMAETELNLVYVSNLQKKLTQTHDNLQQELEKHKNTATSLQESEARYRAIVEDNTDLICRFLPDTTLTFVNETYCRHFGKISNELVGQQFLTLVPEEAHSSIKDHLKSIAVTKELITYQHEVLMPDGSIGWQQWTDRPILNADGQVVEFQSVGHDITELKQAEDIIRKREEQFRILAETATAGILTHQGNNYIYANPAAETITGYTFAELETMQFWEIAHPDLQETIKERFTSRLQGGSEPTQYEAKLQTKQGEVRWIELSVDMTTIQGINTVQIIFFDITERKQIESTLQTIALENKRLAQAVASTSEGIAITDPNQPDNPLIYVNSAFLDITGYTLEECLGRNSRFLQGPKTNISQVDILRKGIKEHREVKVTLLNYRKNGELFWNELKISPIFSDDHQLLYYVGVQSDITERIEAEERLRLIQLSIENTPEATLWVNSEAQFVSVNAGACRHLGYTEPELLKMHVYDIDPRFPAEVWPSHWAELKAKGTLNFEAEHQTKNGDLVPVEIRANYIEFNGQEFNFAHVRNITERKQAEAKLKESEQRFRAIVEALPTALIITRFVDGLTLYVNQAFCDMTGYNTEEITGKRTIRLYQKPEDRDKYVAEVSKNNSIRNYELLAKKADGSSFWASLSAEVIQFEGEEALFTAAEDITTRRVIENERTNFTKQLQIAADFATQINAILDPNQLLREVVDLLQTRFDLYHVHIYLLDEVAKTLIMHIGSGEVGRQLREQNHKISLNYGPSLVAQAARLKEIILVNDTRNDSNFMPNPLLPETRSEVAVPIVSNNRLLGVFDVQDNMADRFNQSDLDTFSILSGQIAISLENARLFENIKQAEASLRQREAELLEAQRIAKLGRWHWDVATGEVMWSDLVHQIFGLPATTTPSMATFQNLIPATDKARVQTMIRESLKSTASDISFETQLIQSDGKPRYVFVTASISRDEANRAYFVQGITQDITERKLAEEAVRESEGRLTQILEAIPVGIYVVDKDNKTYYANQRAHNIFGADILSDQNTDQLFVAGTEQNYPEDQLPSTMALAGESVTIEDIEIDHNGKRIPLEVKTTPIFDQTGQIVYGVVAGQDVTTRKKAEREMSSALEQALEANRIKTELLAKVSHELRTPLNAIVGYTDMLQAQIHGPLTAKQEETLERIFVNGEKLKIHISSLLNQAQMEQGIIELQIVPFRPMDLIDNIQSILSPAAEAKGLKLIGEIGTNTPPTLYGDLQRLQDILINLVGNALKFTEIGSVSIQINRHNVSHWAMRVIDTGPGIETNAQQYIFDSFRQADGSITRKYGGVGLGLSIVKQLTDLMDGQILLESEVGRGTAFTVILPLVPTEETTA